MTITGARQLPNQGARDDLPALRASTEPRGLHHRLAEIVTVLGRRVTDAHADPHPQLLIRAAVARLDRLLHRNRARKRRGSAVEHDHQPIAEVLHLPAARALERPTQQTEMLRPQRLGRLGADTVGHRRRAHKISHQDRDHLWGSGAHPPIIRLSRTRRIEIKLLFLGCRPPVPDHGNPVRADGSLPPRPSACTTPGTQGPRQPATDSDPTQMVRPSR
jgi:hypothetical protein